MSEPIPEAIPTSQDPRNKRVMKRRVLSPTPTQTIALTNRFPPPIEKSTTGTRSGEFHVYKAAQRREYERIRLMEEKVERKKAESEFLKKMEQKRRDEETTGRNRRKRRKKGGKADGKKEDEGGTGDIKTVDSRSGADGEASIPEAEGGGLIIHDDDD
ncbi:hypothetical protein B9Z19DRAFT_1101913 [Tuber borchii]|uniref:DUF1168 domain protein n=1 Tax=Tuber borchii TaxID=42251 RepID=A0A2T6ZPF0_TUBBO|nr:hypothetical protein B9Z19DRAFT_1101913 [Tuber borchii]